MTKQWLTHNGRICGGPAADRLGLPGWEPGFSGAGRRHRRCSLDHQRSHQVPVDRADERVAARFGRRRKAGGPATGDADVKGSVGGGCDGVALESSFLTVTFSPGATGAAILNVKSLMVMSTGSGGLMLVAVPAEVDVADVNGGGEDMVDVLLVAWSSPCASIRLGRCDVRGTRAMG